MRPLKKRTKICQNYNYNGNYETMGKEDDIRSIFCVGDVVLKKIVPWTFMSKYIVKWHVCRLHSEECTTAAVSHVNKTF